MTHRDESRITVHRSCFSTDLWWCITGIKYILLDNNQPTAKVLFAPFLLCFLSFSPSPCPNEDAWGTHILNGLREIMLEDVGELRIQTSFPKLQPIVYPRGLFFLALKDFLKANLIGAAWGEIAEFFWSWLIYMTLNFQSLLQVLPVPQYLINVFFNYLRFILLQTHFFFKLKCKQNMPKKNQTTLHWPFTLLAAIH